MQFWTAAKNQPKPTPRPQVTEQKSEVMERHFAAANGARDFWRLLEKHSPRQRASLAKDRRVDAILKGLATLQAATLRLDQADYAEMQKRLDGLAGGKSSWRYSAKELLGLSAYQNGDLKAAEDRFSALLVDAGTPRNMRDRANVLLALIVSQTATTPDTKADESKAGDADTDDAKTDDANASEATTN